MFKYIAPYVLITGCAMHLICCGIPLFLSMTGLAATLGLSSVHIVEIEWFEVIEKELIVISGILLAITVAAHVISRRLNCYEDAGCCDKPCDDKKSFSVYLLSGACLLYLLNLITVIIA